MTPLSPSDLDFLERYAREATPGPRGCEAGEPVPGEHFYVTGPTPGVAADLRDGVFGEVLMSADKHGDAVLAAFLTPERVLSLVAMARRAPRWIPAEERTPELPPRPVPENKYATVSSAPVLVLVKDGSVHVAQWEATKIYPAEWTFQDHEEATSTGDDVTHWMPLPEPPR